MTLPPSDDFMDDLFGALGDDDPDHDPEREAAAVGAVLGRLGLPASAPVPIPRVVTTERRPSRAALVAAIAAALLLGVFLGRALLPAPAAPVATVAEPAVAPPAVVLNAPAVPPRAPERSGEPVLRPVPDAAPPTPTGPAPAEPELAPPAIAVAAPEPGPTPPAAAPPPRPVPVPGGPGLDLADGTRLTRTGTTGTLERGIITFVRRGDLVPPVERVRFPALGLYALPVGTVFVAAAVEDLALVAVTEGEVHLVREDGTRVGSVRAGESVAVGPGPDGLGMVSTHGFDAAGLAVLLPGMSASEEAISAALVGLRLRSLDPDLVRDLRGLDDLDE